MAKPKTTKARRKKGAPIENNPIEDAVVPAMRLGLTLIAVCDKFFASSGITLLQFNVLRILYVRDPDFEGVPTGTIGARMVSLSPDVPRMIDRLVKAELIERASSPADRRVVLLKLTQKGVDLIEELTPRLLEHNRKLLGDMPAADLTKAGEVMQRMYEMIIARRDEV